MCNVVVKLHNTTKCYTHFEIVAIERQGSTDQCVQDDTQTPDVHLRAVVLLPLKQFRGSVRRTPTEGVQFIARGELITESKVGNFDVQVGI